MGESRRISSPFHETKSTAYAAPLLEFRERDRKNCRGRGTTENTHPSGKKPRESGVEGTKEEKTGGQGATSTAGVEEEWEGRTSDIISGMEEKIAARETEGPETKGTPKET